MSFRTLIRLKLKHNYLKESTKYYSTTARNNAEAGSLNIYNQTQVTTNKKSDEIMVRKVEEVHIVSGVPEEHIKTRKVCIHQPPKNAMQSGTNNINYWQIDFDTRERWENPLMGWSSTGDPMSNLKVEFSSIDEAIEHCNKMGWDYYVQKPNVVGTKPRSYGQNFSWNKKTRVSTK